MNTPNWNDDIIDSRDVIAAIDELESELAALVDDGDADAIAAWNADNSGDLAALRDLAVDGANSSDDWEYGATLIADHHFKSYAQDLADDLGLIDSAATWPASCIDWEQAARELPMDYSAVDFHGHTYWIR